MPKVWHRVRGSTGLRDGGRSQSALDDFVVITGFSGAGKSQAMACFEDAGYFCVDNLPPEMIASLASRNSNRCGVPRASSSSSTLASPSK